MRDAGGNLLGTISVDEPLSGRVPTDDELDLLVALADHAALAVEEANETRNARRHQKALEHLLDVSSRITGETSPDEILRRVCSGIRTALDFDNVFVALVDPDTGALVPRAVAGWSLDEMLARPRVTVAQIEPLLDAQFEREGCFLLTHAQAHSRFARNVDVHPSATERPRAVGVESALAPRAAARQRRRLLGVIWVDNPRDQLLPSADRLQALRIFANDAAAALVSGKHLGELRFLADHDPLTRLFNRRAFVQRLDGEVARATRYGRAVGLVITDIDRFKHQRPLRPPRRRRGARRLLRHPHPRAAPAGRCVPHRRRRVRAAARGDEEEGARTVVERVQAMLAELKTSGIPPSPSSRRVLASPRARPTATTRKRSSASPTRRCTRRSAPAKVCSSSPALAPETGSSYHHRVQRVTLSELDSGERVVSERLAGVRSVSLGFWIDVGSRDERDDRAGVSHFIEHLLFKGSRRFDAQTIAETFDAMGAELNAATSRENTVVFARVPDHHVETALDVMADMVFAPAFAEVDHEREVVLEEIAMYEDTPQELVHDLFSQAVFGDHPLGRPVIGTAEVISTVSRRALSAYHRTAYAPGNVVVAAAGNLEHDRLVALLQRSERRAGAPARAGTRVRRPLARLPEPELRFQRKDTEQYHVCLGATGISRSDRRRFAASLLDSILGGSASSRLFQEIREKRGMAYSVYSFAAQYTDTGVIGVYVGTREENLGACVEICIEQIGEIAAGGCARASSSARRRTSRAASSSRSSRRRTG